MALGGEGSGRSSGHARKIVVEDCLILDANRLVRNGIIGRTPRQGVIRWTKDRSGEQTASAFYVCTASSGAWTLTLGYAVMRRDGRRDVQLTIPLQTTRPHFGGERWWFTCPLLIRGRPCLRRVGKLYLPPGGIYFGCRHCHKLTTPAADRAAATTLWLGKSQEMQAARPGR